MSSDPEKKDLVLSERERTPTEKGNEYFQEIKGSKLKKIQRLWDEIKDLIQHVSSGKLKSVNSIESSEQELFENIDCTQLFPLSFLNSSYGTETCRNMMRFHQKIPSGKQK